MYSVLVNVIETDNDKNIGILMINAFKEMIDNRLVWSFSKPYAEVEDIYSPLGVKFGDTGHQKQHNLYTLYFAWQK